MRSNSAFIMTLLSTILASIMVFVIIRIRKKSQIQKIFVCIVLLLLNWNIGILLEMYIRQLYNYTEMIFVYISYISICYLPAFLLLLGVTFAYTRIGRTWKLYMLFLIPTISVIIVWTNKFHSLFFINYSIYSKDAVYGVYYYFHSAYSYACILIGLGYLIYFSLKNEGFFSKQSILILIAIIFPLTVNVMYSFNLAELSFNINSISFTVSILLFLIAIFRYKFLSVIPIARQRIVALISDGYIVVDEYMDVIDYNETFYKTFCDYLKIERNISMKELLSVNSKLDFNTGKIVKLILLAKRKKDTVSIKKNLVADNFNRHYKIEITPVYIKTEYIGAIILFKDVTQNVRDLEAIKEQQAILLEQERLASLGQLIGGIAHNLKTPIMSISGGIEALKDLTYEYRDSIGDKSVTEQDHKEIAMEMMTWLDKMKPYCSYMSDVISAVKGQAVQMIATGSVKFTVDEVVKRVELLLKHELKRYHCILKVESHIDMSTEIKGEVNNLVQVFDNIIINAMQAYEGRSGVIELTIVRSGDNVEFTFKDYAKGIPKNVADRLFKEMITTKGKNGTGLGLYMSYSTIKGRFGGSMSFTTREGAGTTFFISIPCIVYSNQEAEQ